MTDFTKLSPEDLARVTTRDGRKVEIITTKGRSPLPVVGYIDYGALPSIWGAYGNYFQHDAREHGINLILTPKSEVFYLNKYRHLIGNPHATEESARRGRDYDWLALYRITDDGVNATIEVIERNKGA